MAEKKLDSVIISDHVLLYKNNCFLVANNQVIGIKDGKIICIISELEFNQNSSLYSDCNVYRFKDHLLCPGFVNTHTHLPMSLFRGLADDLPFHDWLNRYILPLESHIVTEEFVKIGTQLSALELIRTGVTTVCDMYFHNHALAKALDQAGLRAYVGVGIPAPSTLSLNKYWWKLTVKNLKEIYQNNSRIQVALAPHSCYAVDSDELKEISEFSRTEDILITIHVSESEWEQDTIYKKHQKTPVQYLQKLGITGPQSLFVHCVYLNKEDIGIMHQTGTACSYNPESNLKLSNGIAPITQLVRAGLRVGLGTDGPASNNNQNFFGEMDTGIKLQKLKEKDQSINAMDMLKMATINGAKALNLEQTIGTIEVGKQADLIAIELNHPQMFPNYHPISDMVYSAQGNEVSFTMCNGKVLMLDKKIRILNEQKIYDQVKIMAKKIKTFCDSSKGTL